MSKAEYEKRYGPASEAKEQWENFIDWLDWRVPAWRQLPESIPLQIRVRAVAIAEKKNSPQERRAGGGDRRAVKAGGRRAADK